MNGSPLIASIPRQRGFSLVTAIFLLVILAMLGAFMVTLSTTQNVTSAQDYQGSQAFRAARAGIEWGVASIKTLVTSCPAPTTMTMGSYSVAVTCTLNSYDEGGTPRRIFWLASTATTGGSVGSIGYIERTMNAFVEF